MITPKSLQPGDKVALISTARKIERETVQPAVAMLERWGLQVVMGQHLFAEHHQFAGTDAQRAADLQQAINDPSIRAIICARGGYGTVRLLDHIDFSALANDPKWIAGYSDVTALHAHIHTNYGIETLHSTMPVNFPTNTPEALASLQFALFGSPIDHSAPAHAMNRNGHCEGEVVGGNLSILYSLNGSNSAINTQGKILFLEDLDEYLYHVDRMMMNLQRSGMLHQLAGLIVGGMSDMNDNIIPFGKTAEEIIWEHVAAYDYPVCFNFPVGHLPDNRTLIVSRKAKLTVGTQVNLAFQ